MDRKTFALEAAQTLERLEARLAALELDELDVELGGDVLTISFASGAKFVLNAHGAAGQIWMAAGTTAWHFDFDAARQAWIAKKSGDELYSALTRAVSRALGRSVALS
jgi:CyaY protein